MQRIDVAERRARLVVRHRLDPAARATDPLTVARSLVCLHATDAVTVFLSIRARSDGVAPADVEQALYEDRSLVRLLAMRRTLWVVPRELVPVVFAAATRAVAATQRKRLEGFVRDSGVSTRPGAWITRAGNAAVAAVAARGEAMTREVVADVPLLATKLRFGSGRWVVEQSAGARVLPQLAMEGRLVRGRPRGSWISPQFRWVTTEDWLGGPIEELDVAAAQAELLRRWLAAFGPATETDMRWWTGWTLRETRAALAAVPHTEVDLGGSDRLRARRTTSSRRRHRSRPRRCCRRSTRRRWAGRSATGTSASTPAPCSTRTETPARPSGGTAASSAAGRSAATARSCSACSRTSARDARAAIDAEVDRLRAWVGDVRFSPGFLPPFQRELAS